MPNVIHGGFMKKLSEKKAPEGKVFEVRVMRDGDVWIAACNELGVFTEASTYEELTDRVWSIAPEMCEENDLCPPGGEFSLSFVNEQIYKNSRIAL